MRADKLVQRPGRGFRGRTNPRPGRVRRRLDHIQHENRVLAAGLPAARGDHQRRVAGRGERGRRTIDERRSPEKLGRDRMPLASRYLVDHHGHGASTLENRSRPSQGPESVREVHAERRSRRLPKGVERPHAEVFGDDKELDPLRHRARREVPVSGMRRRHDHAAAPRERLVPPKPRSAINADMPYGVGAARRNVQDFEGRRSEGSVHRSCLALHLANTGRAHSLFDVRAADAQNATRQPADCCSCEAESAPRKRARDERQGAQEHDHGVPPLSRIPRDARPCRQPTPPRARWRRHRFA